MKIGILTYHCPPNFGAQLQALSTAGFLKKNGHDPVVLDWYASDLEEMYSRRIPKEQVICHQEFTKKYFPLSKRCRTESDLIKEIESLGIDGLIIGSDALFKYLPEKSRSVFSIKRMRFVNIKPLSCELVNGNPFFGGFLRGIKRMIPASVYAASSQNCPYEKMTIDEKISMKEALSNYKYISVRDVWTKQMIEFVTGRNDIMIYPDPVFSFNQNCYFQIPSQDEIIKKYNLKRNYVLLSFSDIFSTPEYISKIADEISIRGYQPVALPMPEKLFSADIDKKIELPLTPLEWYALIIHSCGYIGERMHPIVVCLHNAIPFYCFDEYGVKYRKGLSSKFNQLSSKTFLIVKEAEVLDNLYSYNGGTAMPSAKKVVDTLFSFNVNQCKRFAEKERGLYELGMKVTLESLSGE